MNYIIIGFDEEMQELVFWSDEHGWTTAAADCSTYADTNGRLPTCGDIVTDIRYCPVSRSAKDNSLA